MNWVVPVPIQKKKIPSTSGQSLSCLSHESFSLANNEFSFFSIQLECYQFRSANMNRG